MAVSRNEDAAPGGLASDVRQDLPRLREVGTEERFELLHSLAEVALGDDGVSTVCGLDLMSGELHGHGAGDASPLEISNRGPTQVVNQPVLQSGFATRGFPGSSAALDRLALLVLGRAWLVTYGPCSEVYLLPVKRQYLAHANRSDTWIEGNHALENLAIDGGHGSRPKKYPCRIWMDRIGLTDPAVRFA